MTKIEDYIIQRVKAMRTERGWSQQALADYMNLSQGFIRDIESPRKIAKYNINHINTLAKLFKVPFADFFPDKPFDEE